jgi:hypothetical protein
MLFHIPLPKEALKHTRDASNNTDTYRYMIVKQNKV